MNPPEDQPQLPLSAELRELAQLAAKFADEIRRPPYDPLTGAWSPSTLLPLDDPARTDQPVPMRRRQGAGLPGLLGDDEVDPGRDRVRRVEQERRHRAALRTRFLDELAADTAYEQLYALQSFHALLKAFTTAQQGAATDSPLRSDDAEARLIGMLATELAWLQGAGQRARSADSETRRRAARQIDKLLDLRARGLSLPIIGFVSDSTGARLAFLSDELERWRDALRGPLPEGRQRHQKNDPHFARRMAMSSFRDSVDRAFVKPTATMALVERFAELVGYKNPAAQASR